MTQAHPWSRYVAIGDSFTEGIGDPDPTSTGGNRGWADRVAEVLASTTDGFAYANLAIRGRLLQQIIDEQAQAALDLRPDLISVSAGGNDIIRPGTDPDEVAGRLEGLVETLSSQGATVVLFTGPDIGATPVLGRIRGKVAIYNENVQAIALRHDAVVANMWAMRDLADSRMWAPDRLHFSPLGHHTIARMVLAALAVDNDLLASELPAAELRQWREARREDIGWAREYLVPWVLRRVRHQSSGDGLGPKRPEPMSVPPYGAGTES
ncbi:lysophospholipase L1-like esterase [Frondihabitans sp. PhB188]|uniref:SGNH/GDSL hydrolase family protein n=1 Tax=Frondihabitans sp. PhB188 TaxID=2485200 RepID=UPI000F480BEF|nr:SGNH/GDSL hydrolase family protein [Frondihabitans sp. PhB188]ROQ40932.1 lysophospholipase L1-like esterase [Frondihabitans sp. PhB188]